MTPRNDNQLVGTDNKILTKLLTTQGLNNVVPITNTSEMDVV